MKVAVDTNRYSDFMAGIPEVGEILANAQEIYLPLPVIGELRFGFHLGSRHVENERRLRSFLSKPRVRVLSPDERTTHHYARLMSQLRTQGTPLPINDVWIAALVLQHDLTLFARDKHFDKLPQISRI